jgi:hypothetical protein
MPDSGEDELNVVRWDEFVTKSEPAGLNLGRHDYPDNRVTLCRVSFVVIHLVEGFPDFRLDLDH